jgi:hypothetical protein
VDDLKESADYKRHSIAVFLKRAFQKALEIHPFCAHVTLFDRFGVIERLPHDINDSTSPSRHWAECLEVVGAAQDKPSLGQ